jgi:hypothetical protein
MNEVLRQERAAPSPGTREVVPNVLPTKAVERPVEFLEGQIAVFRAPASDIIVCIEAMSPAARVLKISRAFRPGSGVD